MAQFENLIVIQRSRGGFQTNIKQARRSGFRGRPYLPVPMQERRLEQEFLKYIAPVSTREQGPLFGQMH